MEEYYNNNNRSSQIPAFGSWDCYDGLPFTQCFEKVHQQTVPGAGFIHYTYPEEEDEDLYVAGDLYANDVVTPAMIVVPRRRTKKLAKVEDEKENDGKAGKGWEVGNFNKEPQISPTNFAPIIKQKKPKPVDEDLYKISPDLLYAKTNKKRSGLSFFSCCGL